MKIAEKMAQVTEQTTIDFNSADKILTVGSLVLGQFCFSDWTTCKKIYFMEAITSHLRTGCGVGQLADVA